MQSLAIVTVLVLACSFNALAFDAQLNQHWKLWKETNEKRYADAEELVRRAIWENNWRKVREHNLQADLGLHTYWLGMNQFADLTVTEFAKNIGGFSNTSREPSHNDRPEFIRHPNVKLPDTVDWREKGYVTPVKAQGQCVGGWAFSATGALEGQHFNATGKLVPLSEQNLIDCGGKEGGQGCVGGQPSQAFQYIKDNNGIDTEDSYPFEEDERQCRFNAATVGATVTGFTAVKSKDESALQEAVATIGPISVMIDSNHDSFQLYKQGIYHEAFCSQIHLDHALLVVGYGADSGKDYWLAKNSFGTGWGEQGYIRMTRNKRNECGIATTASYPLV